MRTFSERNRLVIGAVGIAVALVLGLLALNINKLPVINRDKSYSAYFAEAGGLAAGSFVEVSGARVGTVSSVTLDGPRVLVKFKVSPGVRLGDRTEAAIKLKTLLGTKLLAVTPQGGGQLTEPIPLNRTTPAYQLPDALGDLATTIDGLNTDQLSDSLAVLANEFSNTAPDLKAAVQGVARFSDTLNKRDEQLRNLLSSARKVTGVLAERSDQVVNLVKNTNALLAELNTQSSALDQIAGNLAAAAEQVKGFIADNRQSLKPALDKLNAVLTIVDNRKERVQKALKGLTALVGSLGESVSSGPFFKAYVVNLLPGQFVQPFIDAAFSDLGLDPATKLPSELADPQTGQPGTPALPIPFPRTGQGGDPRMSVPDAITGNPDDHACGPPGVPLPGPGCYPYREEPPAPPPGGPPPGPPALIPGQSTMPTPRPVLQLAPGEGPSSHGPGPGLPQLNSSQPAAGGEGQ